MRFDQMLIQKIEDFKPEFTKEYADPAGSYTIEVQYRGVFMDDETGTGKTYNYWAFKLWYGGELIVAGPHRKPADEEMSTLEQVANILATFFGHDILQLVNQSRNEERQKKLEEEQSLDEIVQMCWSYAMTALWQPRFPHNSEYDILQAFKNDETGGWDVILEMKFDPSSLYMFSKKKSGARIYIATYIKAHQHSIPKF